MYSILESIAKKLNGMEVVWALGASSVLYYNGYETRPNDIDLFVMEEDFENIRLFLLENGIEKHKPDTEEIYNTQKFSTIEINGVDVDLIAGFFIKHEAGEYRFNFDHHSIDKVVFIENEPVNIMALEDWYILYQLIPGREKKVKVIKEMLIKKNTIRMDLINRTLILELPKSVRASIIEIIK
ncbi:MAG: nucleotidyltransferase family protein [Clostridiales bacterium]|nr:nucleotidyltransferase family protein [Clostridiales bacterium]